ARELGHDLAVREQLDGRDAADAEARGELRVRLRVDLHERPRVARLGVQRLQDGAEDAARAAPRRPEVHEHGPRAAGLEDVPLETDDGMIVGGLHSERKAEEYPSARWRRRGHEAQLPRPGCVEPAPDTPPYPQSLPP